MKGGTTPAKSTDLTRDVFVRVCIILLLNLFVVMAHAFSVTELEALRRKYGAPGLAASVVKPQSIDVWVTGLRKIGSDVKISDTDKFHLGSNTKAMTATLLAQLIEAGTLSWQSTLQEIFPELSMRVEFLNVSVEMLAAHRSGITGDMGAIESGELWSWMWQNNSTKTNFQRLEIARRLLVFPAQHTPGTTFLYSNWNYIIIGAILEKLSNQSWEILMRKKLFEPLGMPSCGFGAAGNTEATTPDQPWPHTSLNGVFTPVSPTSALDNPKSLGPAGTVHCSLQDWGKFLQAHLNGFNRRDTPILRASSYQKLHTPYPGQEYTPGAWLSFAFRNRMALQHTGSNTMNFANVWLLPADNVGVFVTTNAAGSSIFELTDSVIGELLKSIFTNGFEE